MAKSSLLDHLGRPIDMSQLSKSVATAEFGSVRQPMGEMVTTGINPAALAAILKNSIRNDPAQYLSLAEEMEEKDPHYAAVLATRKRQVSQLPITVMPADDDKISLQHAEFVREFVERPELQSELLDILDAIGKGFSLTEIYWEQSERQWMPKFLEWCDPRWFDFDPVNRKDVMLKEDSGLVPLTYGKFIYFTAKAKSGLDVRGGLARLCSWPWLFKNFDMKSWLQFLEVFGQPIRIGRYNSSALEDQKRTLLRAIRNIGRDAAAIIPANMNIEFVDSKANAQGALFENMANYLDLQMSKAVLGQTTTTDAVSGGHAVSKEHNQVREDIERSDANQLSAVLTRDLAIPMIRFNFGDQIKYPQIIIGREDSVDVKLYLESVSKAKEMGVETSKTQFYKVTGIQAPDNKDDILGGDPIEQKDAKATASQIIGDDKDQIDVMTDDLLSDWQAAMKPMIQPVIKQLASVSSIEEFSVELAKLAQDMDETELAQVLSEGMATARIAGAAGVTLGEDQE